MDKKIQVLFGTWIFWWTRRGSTVCFGSQFVNRCRGRRPRRPVQALDFPQTHLLSSHTYGLATHGPAVGTRLHRSAGKTVHCTLFLFRRPSRVRPLILTKTRKHLIRKDGVFSCLVDPKGIEPSTLRMRTVRSPS